MDLVCKKKWTYQIQLEDAHRALLSLRSPHVKKNHQKTNRPCKGEGGYKDNKILRESGKNLHTSYRKDLKKNADAATPLGDLERTALAKIPQYFQYKSL